MDAEASTRSAPCCWRGGDLAGARERFDSVVAISRQTGNRIDEGRSLSDQGLVLERLGSLGEAQHLQDQA